MQDQNVYLYNEPYLLRGNRELLAQAHQFIVQKAEPLSLENHGWYIG